MNQIELLNTLKNQKEYKEPFGSMRFTEEAFLKDMQKWLNLLLDKKLNPLLFDNYENLRRYIENQQNENMQKASFIIIGFCEKTLNLPYSEENVQKILSFGITLGEIFNLFSG
jgi:hypothetical protein